MGTSTFDWMIAQASAKVVDKRENVNGKLAGRENRAEVAKPDLFDLARRLYSQGRLQRRYRRSGSIV